MILDQAKRTHKGQIIRLGTHLRVYCHLNRSCRLCHADGLLPPASSRLLRVAGMNQTTQSKRNVIGLDKLTAAIINELNDTFGLAISLMAVVASVRQSSSHK